MAKDYMFTLSLNIVKKNFEKWFEELLMLNTKVTITEFVWESVVSLGNELNSLISTVNSKEYNVAIKDLQKNMLINSFETLELVLETYHINNLFTTNFDEKEFKTFQKQLENIIINFKRCLENYEKYGINTK